MKVMSSGGGVRSSGGSNQSSTGANEENRNSDGNPHPGSSSTVVGRYPVTPEWSMSRGNTGGIEKMGMGSFKGSDAAHEDMCRHPNKSDDPASIKIAGSNE